MPCRGTGRVISNLGGAPQPVACPWCRGGGVRLTGVDAQASQAGGESEERAGGEGEPPDAAA
jgi:hypothetical protein